MQPIGFAGIMEILSNFGPFGVIVIIWFFDSRAMRSLLATYKEDMQETRQMYKNNVRLVEDYEELATDLKDVIILNTTQITHLSDSVENNEFCPMVRQVRKQPIEEPK